MLRTGMTNTVTKIQVVDAIPSDTYHVRATQGDGWWGITVDELETVFAQTRHYDDVESEARSAIAFWFDVQESEVGRIIVTKSV